MNDTPVKKIYITTPIYYVNGLPHVGSALSTIACDVLARYHRLQGQDTFLLTGVDENATKVQEAAGEAGKPTLEFVEGLSSAFQECWRDLNIFPDDFIRTTDPRHVRAVQEFFARLLKSGYVYLDTYEGWYSVSDETFFRDSEVQDGIAIESGKPVVRVQEQNYFFKLSAFGDRILEHIEANPDFLSPEFRKNEVISFVKEGLRDMSITRANRGWGIPVPGDESKIIYVWFDALINYLAATGWPDAPDWQSLWPADLHFMGKEIFVRFHATLWPAMLMALDLPLPKQIFAHGWWTVEGGKKGGKTGPSLPHPTRFTNLLMERSGACFLHCADAQRYLLCREMNFGMDTEFTVENCLRRFNTDLANDLGNLLNRTINMMSRYFDSVVPEEGEPDPEIVALTEQVQLEYVEAMRLFRLNSALEAIWKLVSRMNKYIDEKAPWTLAKAAGKGDAQSQAKLQQTLYACLEVIRQIAILISPFMPHATEAICEQLGIGCREEDAQDPIPNTQHLTPDTRRPPTPNNGGVDPTPDTRHPTPYWSDLKWGGLRPGTKTGLPMPIFPRIQDLTVDAATLRGLASSNTAFVQEAASVMASDVNEIEKSKEENLSESKPLQSTLPVQETASTEKAPGKLIVPSTETAPVEMITIDDFLKVQIRVGEILVAEPVPNATKLLRLTVQIGEDDTRTILAGIAEFYQPEMLVGRLVAVIVNLQPRKMRGIESQGMLLAADVDGRAILLQPDCPVPSGSRIR